MAINEDPKLNCDCEACRRDGVHEPDCGVHQKPPRECDCGREDESSAPG